MKAWTIEPRSHSLYGTVREAWRERRLVRYFASRAVARIYRRTILGATWLVLRPGIPVVLGSLVFGGILQVSSGDRPYFLFFLAGAALWNLFENSALWATRSLELNGRLITRIYFPRIVLPISSLAPAIVDFAVHLMLLAAAIIYFGLVHGRWYTHADGLLVAVTCVIIVVVLGLGVGLWMCGPQARARDVRFTLRYVMRFWFYFTPIIYPLSSVPREWRLLALANPLASTAEAFRWAVIGEGHLEWRAIEVAILLTICISFGGAVFFHRAEAAAVDRL